MRKNWWKPAVVVLLVVAVAAVVASKNGKVTKPHTETEVAARVSTETTEPAKTTPNDAAKAEPGKQETVTEPKAADIKQGEPKATPADKPVVKPADKPKASAATPKPAQPKPAFATAEKKAPRQEVKVEQPQAQSKRLPVLLELGADKCIPCKKMKPIIDELEKEYEGRVDVRFIDVWKPKG